MLSRVDLTLDCSDAEIVAAFWKTAAEERWTRISDEVERLRAAGASTVACFEGHHVVMAHPEGNEFCVC